MDATALVESKCKFCGADAPLVAAHIIPKSFYGDLVSEGQATKLMSSTTGAYPKRIPKGIYDSTIVCSSCEARFSPWDDYAHHMFNEIAPVPFLGPNDEVVAHTYHDLDYSKAKLFFLSLLWRAHASSQVFFRKVDLGSLESRLKTLLSNNDPGEPEEFAVLMARFDHELSGTVLDPHPEKYEGINFYRFYLPGYAVYFKVDSRPVPEMFRPLVLKPGTGFHVVTRDFEKGGEHRVLLSIAKSNLKAFQ